MRRRYWNLLKNFDGPSSFGSSSSTDSLPMPARKPQRASPRKSAHTKLFVLDSNVMMHDPTSLFRFEEHDLYLPIMALEELDANKKGMSEVARNARQTSRFLDELVNRLEGPIAEGIPLARTATEGSQHAPGGRLF